MQAFKTGIIWTNQWYAVSLSSSCALLEPCPDYLLSAWVAKYGETNSGERSLWAALLSPEVLYFRELSLKLVLLFKPTDLGGLDSDQRLEFPQGFLFS